MGETYPIITACAAGQVAAGQPPVGDRGRSPMEVEDYETHQWRDVPEIIRSQDRFYPGRLPELLPRFLSGGRDR